MDNFDNHRREQREAYLDNWYRVEKSARRIAAVILFFVAAIIVVFDKPGDGWTVFALTTSMAGSITLLLLSRKPRADRIALHFLKAEIQASRSNYAGLAAIVLFTLFNNRPLAIIASAILVLVSLWFQWRANKVKQFDALFNQEPIVEEIEGDNRA